MEEQKAKKDVAPVEATAKKTAVKEEKAPKQKVEKKTTKTEKKQPAKKVEKKTEKKVKEKTVKASTKPEAVEKKAKAEKVERKSVKAPTKTKTIDKKSKKETVEKKPVMTSKKTEKVEKKAKTEKAEKKPVKKVEKKPVKTAKKQEKIETIEKIAPKTEKIVKKEPKNVQISGFHDLQLNGYVYDNVTNPKAVVVIVHGMQEHCLRYKPFAEFLNANGYAVVTTDLRGHGHTMKNKDEYGKGEQDIFSECVKDQLKVIDYAHSRFNLPVYLFGHSFGSMITQRLVQQSPRIEKAILCGTTNGDSTIFGLGSMMISIMNPFKKKDPRGGLAEKMCVEGYGKKFERGNWLTRDEAVFDAYKADELCGGTFPFSFYRSLVKNMCKVNDGISKIGNKKLFLIAGTKDPVGENGKQVTKLYKIYLKNNIDAKLKLYEGARHELLNETNKEEVYADCLHFFDN